MAIREKGLPRDAKIRYQFKTKPFDFMFQWITGGISSGIGEIGELMYAASRIKDGDGESWYQEFTDMGERILKRAVDSEKKGCLVSAGSSLLRCYSFFRAAPLFFNPRSDKRYKDSYFKARELFRKGLRLSGVSHEILSIPFEDFSLPGYLFLPEKSKSCGKTLIMLGGGDTFVEDLFFYIVPAAQKRGYTLVMVDLPGQGPLPWQKKIFPVKSERSVSAVVDYLDSRGDIDLKRLALYGISGGGYLSTRAVCYEKRVKALAACSVILDFKRIWDDRLLELPKTFIGKYLKTFKKETFTSVMNLVDTYRWRFGAENNSQLKENCRNMEVDPKKIDCPVLNIVAEQEYTEVDVTRKAAHLCEEIIDDYTLVVTPADEGADTHAVGTNISLMSQIVFDWLDKVL